MGRGRGPRVGSDERDVHDSAAPRHGPPLHLALGGRDVGDAGARAAAREAQDRQREEEGWAAQCAHRRLLAAGSAGSGVR